MKINEVRRRAMDRARHRHGMQGKPGKPGISKSSKSFKSSPGRMNNHLVFARQKLQNHSHSSNSPQKMERTSDSPVKGASTAEFEPKGILRHNGIKPMEKHAALIIAAPTRHAGETKFTPSNHSIIKFDQSKPDIKKDEFDIDALFAGKRRKAETQRAAENKQDLAMTGKYSKKKAPEGMGLGGSGRGDESTRYTEEGYRVYTYDDIRMQNVDILHKLTGPCPFDCACCF